jgi:hypothetical protein
MTARALLIGVLVLPFFACAPHMPTAEETDSALQLLRDSGPWAWLAAIGLICADLALRARSVPVAACAATERAGRTGRRQPSTLPLLPSS